jgi:hypothetical protein
MSEMAFPWQLAAVEGIGGAAEAAPFQSADAESLGCGSVGGTPALLMQTAT